MKAKFALTCSLAVLSASVAFAQPTPTRIPPKFTVATAPVCANGEPRLYSVTDAASSASCAIGGGTTEVICQCLDGTASVVGSGSGGSAPTDADYLVRTANGSLSAELVVTNTTTAQWDWSVAGQAKVDVIGVTCEDCLTGTEIFEGSLLSAVPTATALAANGANCSAGQYPLGVDASGAVESCTADNAGTDDQTATEVPYTPTTGTNWVDPDPTHAGGGLDALASRLTTEEAKADDDVPESGDFGAAADLEGDGSLSIDVVAPAEMADADHGDVSWTSGVAAVDTGAVGLTELADDAGCTTGQDVRRNVADTAFECYTPGAASGDVVGPASATDNAVARFDTTTGKLIQDSALTVSDVVAGVVTFATTAGNGLTVDTTEPTATTGASVAGKATLMSAGNAVASTDTNGAAGGGDFSIFGGEAARLVSGDAPGGNIILRPGTHVGGGGTGRSGQVRITAPTGGLSSQWPLMTIAGGTYPTLQLSSWYMGSPAFRGEHFAISEDVAGGGYEFFIDGLLNGVSLKRIVSASTAGSGAPQAVGAGALGFPYFSIATNEGATAKVYFQLDTAASGKEQAFYVQDADGIRVVAAAGDTIRIGATVSSAGGYCESVTIGDSLTVDAINATEWGATHLVGSGWTCALFFPALGARRRLRHLIDSKERKAA